MESSADLSGRQRQLELFRDLTDGKPEHDPSHFRILPADRYQFHGTLVRERTIKDGLGAPMVIASKGFDPTKFDPFIQGKNVYYGVTEVLQFKGRNCTAAYIDPLATETVNFAGHTYPVAADFTAPLALALAELAPRKTELQRLVQPGGVRVNHPAGATATLRPEEDTHPLHPWTRRFPGHLGALDRIPAGRSHDPAKLPDLVLQLSDRLSLSR